MPTVPHGPTAGNDPISAPNLVIFAPNWLGDAVMALPAIGAVCRSGRHAAVSIAAAPSIMPLFTLVDGIDAVIDVRTDLRGRSFDAALLLPNSFHAALIAWRAGIPERWGYRTQGRGPMLTRAIGRGARSHQAAYYQRLISALDYPTGPLQPEIRVSTEMSQAAGELLSRAGWDQRAPLAAFAPGAANGRAKQWPPESFARLARELAQDGVVTVLIGTPSDTRAGAALIEALGSRAAITIINLIGRTDLPALAGVLTHCRALICNDSGAMHFAAALGVSVTAMFGPSNEMETRPLGAARTAILTHLVWCRPCMLRECPLDHACMRGITVDSVLAAARASMGSQ